MGMVAKGLGSPLPEHPAALLNGRQPVYSTAWGAAYHGEALELMRELPSKSIKAVITSPPYALQFKKEYGNATKMEYVDWMLPFAKEIKRILLDNGSFILNIGGSYNSGTPTRSLYHFRLLIALCDEIGFHLAQECFWHNPAKLPAPAEWVNVRRLRVKDSVEYIWWLSPTAWPDADNRRVLGPYSTDMLRLIEKGYVARKRPSGHKITGKFRNNGDGSIPSNLIICGNTESASEYIRACQEVDVKVHPARFPSALPRFFTTFLTEPGDLVMDPFAGSNTTGRVAEDTQRRWIAIDVESTYARASGVRFGLDPRRL